MAGDPLLDFTNLDEVFAFMDQAVAKDCHEPRPFPKTDSERRDILESLARDRSALKTVLLQTLTTISLEDQALKSGFLPWVEPYSPKLEQLPAIAWSPSYVQFFNAEETRLLVGACGRCWKTIKQSHLFPAHWRQFQGKMFEPDVIRSLPSPQKEFAAHFLEQPRQRQIAVMKVTTQIVLRAASLEGLRELLEVLRDALRAIEGLRARLESSMATEPDIQEKTAKRQPDNPDVRDLCHELAKNAKLIQQGKKTEIGVAREFTGEAGGQRPEDLLRQARRYPHLWKPDK